MAEELCELSLLIRRSLTVMMDLQGRVCLVVVSDADSLDQLALVTPVDPQSGLNNLYAFHTHLGWHPPSLGDQVTLLQYHFPVLGVLIAGVEAGFSRKHGENTKFCDAAFLLHPLVADGGGALEAETAGPMTARALEDEPLGKWQEWAEPVFAQSRSREAATRERAFLINLLSSSNDTHDHSLEELIDLVQTAGAEVLGDIQQTRSAPDPKTFIGSGKAEELSLLIQQHQANLAIANEPLSPVQQRNLEKILRVKVIDRTEVILDIFAQRARSREGQIQVELAQLQYLLPRLIGRGRMFSQQTSVGAKGGIATRGPGETKLETDRRILHQRISRLEKQAEEVVKHRHLQRQKREASQMKTASLVGYTNAGKSTLLKTLTGADVLVENKLFATLDPTTRKLHLPDHGDILLSDTVGFIQKLPTFMVKAFRATLEETQNADLIIHVWNVSHPNRIHHLETVQETMEDLGVAERPIITLCNKIDLCEKGEGCDDWRTELDAAGLSAQYPIPVSAVTGEGLPAFLKALGYFYEHGTLPELAVTECP